MVVIAFVGSADDHDDEVLARVDTEVVNRRLQEVTVLGEPFGKIQGGCKRHIEGYQGYRCRGRTREGLQQDSSVINPEDIVLLRPVGNSRYRVTAWLDLAELDGGHQSQSG